MGFLLFFRLNILAVFSGALFALSLPNGVLQQSRWIVALLCYWPLAWGIAQCDSYKDQWGPSFSKSKQSYFLSSFLALFLCELSTNAIIFYELFAQVSWQDNISQGLLSTCHILLFLSLMSLRLPIVLAPLVILRDLRAHFRFFNSFPCWFFAAITVALETLLGHEFLWSSHHLFLQTWLETGIAVTKTEPIISFFYYLPIYYIASNEGIFTKTINQFLIKLLRPIVTGTLLFAVLVIISLTSNFLIDKQKKYTDENPTIRLYSHQYPTENIQPITATRYGLHVLTHPQAAQHNLPQLAQQNKNSLLVTPSAQGDFQLYRPDGSSSPKVTQHQLYALHRSSKKLRWLPGMNWAINAIPNSSDPKPPPQNIRLPIIPITPSFSVFALYSHDLQAKPLMKHMEKTLKEQKAVIITQAPALPVRSHLLENIEAAKTAYASRQLLKPLLYLCPSCGHRYYTLQQTTELKDFQKATLPQTEQLTLSGNIFWNREFLLVLILVLTFLFSIKSYMGKRKNARPF